MSGPYCPDCGAQCNPGAAYCPECKFPMELKVTTHSKGLLIDSSQMDRWKRVSQILKRGGLRIQTRPDPSNTMVWWLLPMSGMAILVITLLFGHRIVDKIWEPPKAGNVLSLPALNGEDLPESDAESIPEDSLASLKEAFKTSDEQRQFVTNDSVDLSEYVDRQEADLDQIRKAFSQAFLSVRVDNTRWRGTLISNDGLLLVDSRLVADAFRREIRTINRDRNISEQAVWIVPVAGLPGGEASIPTK